MLDVTGVIQRGTWRRHHASMTPHIGMIVVAAMLLGACQQASTGETAPPSTDAAPASAPASASASEAPDAAESEPAADGVTVTVSETAVGPALAGEDGMTLYVLFNDFEDGSGCIDACEDAWPPFTVEQGTEVVAGDGVDPETIGTTTRPDGSTQVTFGPRPLYYYAGDTSPGDANGHEVGDVWFVARP